MSNEQKFETEDLTFVAVLRVNGLTPSEKRKEGRGCRWVFLGPDSFISQIMDLLRDYNDNCADVEPREFTIAMGTVRRDMYQFLGYQPPRVRS